MCHHGENGRVIIALSLTSALDWSVLTPQPSCFTPENDLVPTETGWAPGASLDRCGKSHPQPGTDP
jgi:hypothetical protein